MSLKPFVSHAQMEAVHSEVVDEVLAEMSRQDDKWGEQNHGPAHWLAILTEEFGEYGKEVVAAEFAIVNAENYRYEAIQTAAVAIRIVESFDRAREVARQIAQRLKQEPSSGTGPGLGQADSSRATVSE